MKPKGQGTMGTWFAIHAPSAGSEMALNSKTYATDRSDKHIQERERLWS